MEGILGLCIRGGKILLRRICTIPSQKIVIGKHATLLLKKINVEIAIENPYIDVIGRGILPAKGEIRR